MIKKEDIKVGNLYKIDFDTFKSLVNNDAISGLALKEVIVKLIDENKYGLLLGAAFGNITWSQNVKIGEFCEKFDVYEQNDSTSFDGITKKMLDTYTKKNHDYGNAFSEMYDELGINYGYGKIREKVNRIKTLKDGDAMVKNEPLEDALLDCANYCILTLMEYQKHKKDGKD